MPYPYMIGKGRWGTYGKSFEYSAKVFATRDPGTMAAQSGSYFDRHKSHFRLGSFGQELEVSFPEARVTFAGTSLQPSFTLSLCVVNYLARADGTPLTNRLISYRELENGMVFYPAFRREAINMLSRWVSGKSPELLARAALELGGEITGGADFACALRLLPRFPATLRIWLPDEELGGSANILFDSTANHYLHTEDIAVIGELAACYLVRHYELLEGKSEQGAEAK